jgi:L-malate glycosyltransferase
MNYNILHIIPTFGKGGGARVVIDLANFAIEEQNSVEILVAQDSPLQNVGVLDSLNKGIHVKYALKRLADVPHKSNFFGTAAKFYLWLLFSIWILRNKKYLRKFDIIHVHMPIAVIAGNIIWFLKATGNWKCRIFETVHSDSKSLKSSTLSLFRFSWKYRDGVIFEIREEDMTLLSSRYPKIRTQFIPLGVNIVTRENHLENRAHLRERLGIGENEIVIGQVGRLNIQDRRSDIYPKLFRSILNKITKTDSIKFILFGDGPDRDLVEKSLFNLGIQSQTIVYGFVNNLQEAFSIIDFYITVNIRKDCGIAGLQAISYGLPTFGIQGDLTYLDGLNDWIPSDINIDKLASYIVQTVENAELGQEMVTKQQNYFQNNVSVDLMCRRTLEFYSC